LLAKSVGDQLPPKAQGYVKTIAQSAQRMGDLIDDLLTFSRMQRVEMHERHVDLSQIIDDIRAQLQGRPNGRTVQWRVADLPSVQGDPAMLRQVVVNLLENAMKYTRTRDPAMIEIGIAGREDEREIFFVRDNGVGFDMQYAHKLFGVFQRLHNSSEFEGTGIGLANVRRIIERHGGRIWAEAEVDKGATFFFTLKPSEMVDLSKIRNTEKEYSDDTSATNTTR
jgi:light-regulated signal transduction histidine kinase (bacteriophytochrome)